MAPKDGMGYLIPMRNQTRIKIEKRDSVFSAAHFLADMGKCERMHGHNYFVSVEVEGAPDQRGAVIDFNQLDSIVSQVCQPLDHMILIAQKSPTAQVATSGDEVEVKFKNKRYLLPKEDCLLLPLESTTVESLAGYLLDRILEKLGDVGGRLYCMEVGVGEGGSKMAFHQKQIG
ncbi:MAG: 6-pyruvoyl tetrahydropterin synthase family protein [Nitrospinota bacterium]|nr:6-pyruvoyl tetrahydropterin synthase family protein [Nitrospinota bacterium]